MNVWFGWLIASLLSERALTELSWFPKTGGHNLLTARRWPPETVQDSIEQDKPGNPDYILLVFPKDGTWIRLCPHSNSLLYYLRKRYKPLCNIFQMEEGVIPKYLNVGHWIGQRAIAGFSALHALRYGIYVIPHGTDRICSAICLQYLGLQVWLSWQIWVLVDIIIAWRNIVML